MVLIKNREEADGTLETCSQGFWSPNGVANEVNGRVVSASPGMRLTSTGSVDMAI